MNFMHARFPGACLLCGGRADIPQLCADCRADLPWHHQAACPVCALPTPLGETCAQCLQHPPPFSRTVALFDYRFPLDALIPALKYRHQLPVADLLGRLLAAKIGRDIQLDGLVPMPLHPLRLRERGFNQALEIARPLAAQNQLPLRTLGIERILATPPQVGTPREERMRNLRHAFKVGQILAGQRLAIIDDVMTTGASCHALAQALRAQGAEEVQCWVIARTLATY